MSIDVQLHLGTHDNEHSDFSDIEQEIERILAEGKDVAVLIEDAEALYWESKYLEFAWELDTEFDYETILREITTIRNKSEFRHENTKFTAFENYPTFEHLQTLREDLHRFLRESGSDLDKDYIGKDMFTLSEHNMLMRLMGKFGKRVKILKEYANELEEPKPDEAIMRYWKQGYPENAKEEYWDYIARTVKLIQERDETIAVYLNELLESQSNRSFIVIAGTLHKNIANHLKDIKNIEVKVIIRNKNALESNASNRLQARLLDMGDFSKYDFRKDSDFNFLFEEYIIKNPNQEEQ